MKRRIIYTTLAFIIFTSNKAYPYDWTTETVSDVVSGYYASLAVDSGGDPFIAYKNPLSNSALKLAIKKNDSWNLLTVDDENPGSEHFALALNNQGMPRIAYDGSSYMLHYFENNEYPYLKARIIALSSFSCTM